jgi:hypothetical protein
MKIFKLFVLGTALFFASAATAQISVHFNVGTAPSWGPVGYSDVRYYYLPDVQAYYDVPSSMFIYYEGSSWVRRSYLPSRYRNYDLYRGYKVVMNDYHGNAPYRYYNQHKKYYNKGYHNGYQKTNGERPNYGNKYENNQVNRGRNDNHYNDRKYDDYNYDKRGNEKSYKSHNGNNGHQDYNGNNGYNGNNCNNGNNGKGSDNGDHGNQNRNK